MRQLTGTEKQIAYANDLIDRKIAEIETYLSNNQLMSEKIEELPARFANKTMEEKLAKIEDRKRMNMKIAASRQACTEAIEKLNNLSCAAGDAIDGMKFITNRGTSIHGNVRGVTDMNITLPKDSEI